MMIMACRAVMKVVFLTIVDGLLVPGLLPSISRIYSRMKLYMDVRHFLWTVYWLVKHVKKHRGCFSKHWYVY
ncbi:hypothetical protein Gohar_007862 [Gossypium harknessii]|uniref:Uncharacterized protein n=2 Tax=Gossypium TaxID=3633 RepID=A0A7J8TIE0_GOSDV|nr:hypothetical protein [Gossypium davidsonii]MBA0797140.1 hypothetical protein [Gossypium harknessii]